MAGPMPPGPHGSAPEPLSPDTLYRHCDADTLGFRTTAEIEPPRRIVGQDRAVEAIRFGVGIDRDGFNMFALGPSGTGKHTLVRQFLTGRAQKMPAPPDICYVNNFEEAHKPHAVLLPAGRGARFRRDMEQFVELVKDAIPRAFEDESYRNRSRDIEARFRAAREQLLQKVQEEAERNAVTLLRTPNGIALAPVRNGEVVSPEDFEKWPEDDKAKARATIEKLQAGLQDALAEMPKLERRFRDEIAALNQSTTVFAVGHLIDDLRREYGDVPEAGDHLDRVRKDLVENVEAFMRAMADGAPDRRPGPGDEQETPSAPRGVDGYLKRYKVNLLVDNGGRQGAPVVYEDLPNLQSLIGRIEHIVQFGALTTDFTLIHPGALHRANGGYLILDARKVLIAPFAWDELKRALTSREIRIESPERLMSVATPMTLEPEAVPLNVKVVLLGERELYYVLTRGDPEFSELFKVEIDFDETWPRTAQSTRRFCGLLASIVRENELRPLEAGAVARVIEHAARLADDADKLTMHLRSISDLLQEADYWACANGNAHVTAADVQQAIDAKIRRADRIRDMSYELITRDTILIDTSGAVTGQVNALSVMQLGKFPFGRPTRMTARVRLGRGQVIDIEREVELGGPLHSKGVLILAAFLGARYCPDMPLSLSASLVFEQSYGGVDGDSASSTELYALLSALADAPIDQSLAVTGSVNQMGEVQAIGGVNEKVEGFFDICRMDGLTGRQGVLIPKANIRNLMLRHDVVDAVRDGKFNVWPVSHIDEGIELLTGIAAGARGADGRFPADSINGRVEARLEAFAAAARRFADRCDDRRDGEGDR